MSTRPSSFSIGGIEFVRIPEGESAIGSRGDRYAYDFEFPQHKIKFDYTYAIAKHPITNQEFAAFVQQAGFKTKAEAEGGYIGSSRSVLANWRLPDGQATIDGKEDHPVVQINWMEAQEFCRWLSDRFGQELPARSTVRLPTEVEWERAARGEDGRIYPWGNEFSQDKCNIGYATTPVSRYSPQGDSPWGVADMAGNVWEWTHTIFSYQFRYPYRPRDGREQTTGTTARSCRGGGHVATANMERICRCACREPKSPADANSTVGFRVVIAPPLEAIDKASIFDNEITLFIT